jgi:hypothetical protein
MITQITRLLIFWTVTLTGALSILAQGTVDEHGVYHPTEEEIANSKRLYELLKHPTFVSLKLVSTPRYSGSEPRTDAPPPFKVRDLIHFELFVTQNSLEDIRLSNFLSPHYEYRPELFRDGDVVPYTKTAQEKVERFVHGPPNGSMVGVTLEPGHEYHWSFVNLEDWYEPLGPGRYELVVRKRFTPDGGWVKSNPVIFEVQARNPRPIPAGINIELAPQGLQAETEAKPYQVNDDLIITVYVVNNSDERLKVDVIDNYYGNRFQLFKDGGLMPYREETKKLIQSKDENPPLVETVPSLYVDPHTASGLQNIRLSDWYGPLTPGSYRLIDRRRFEIDGPWTLDSAPMHFEIVQKKQQ